MTEKSHGKHPSSHESRAASKAGAESAAAHPEGSSGQPPPLSAEELERMQQEVSRANDQYLRTLAEFENTKKRLHREKETFVRYASETVIRQLLPIVDSLDHALVAVDRNADPQAITKGVHLIYRQLLGLLDREGVKRIQTMGKPFDPHQHEAVAQVAAGDGMLDDTVVEEVQVGYTLHDKVLRPAMVKVAKKSSPQSTVGSPQMTEKNKGEVKE
ncbi:MAG: nucleotide exchange factor GrpE [Candidatus Omnitrophica bacterium]|nr:nucleotide exchange factor GrpE [Candidatus Omnitrophota bacterium]